MLSLCCGCIYIWLCLLREIHHAASSGCTWRDAWDIGSHLVDSVAIAVHRCNGQALHASVEMEDAGGVGSGGVSGGIQGVRWWIEVALAALAVLTVLSVSLIVAGFEAGLALVWQYTHCVCACIS